MKKYFLGLLALFTISSMAPAFASNFKFGIDDAGGEDDTIVATHEIAVGGVKEDQEEGFIDNVVKSIVNWVLGLSGLIALLVMLYGGFLMVTSAGNEENYNQGWKILKAAAIGLALIGTAWFVLSLIFWLIVQSGDGVTGAGTDT